MAKVLFVLLCWLSFSQINSQTATALSYLSPRPDIVFDVPRNYFDVPKNDIIGPPRNFLQPNPVITDPFFLPISNYPLISTNPNIAPSTTLINDCTPSVCQHLADTINLMIVSNLLENSLRDTRSLKMAAPFLRNVLSDVELKRLAGPPVPSLINPYFIGSNSIGSNNVIPSRYITSNPIASNLPPNNVALSCILKTLGNVV